MGNIDLDILVPERDETVTLTDLDGNKYDINMFIPFAISLASIKALKEDKELPESNLEILELFLTNQYAFMNKDWIVKNISMPKQDILSELIVQKITKSREVLTQLRNNTIPDGSKKKGENSSTVK